MNTNDIIGLLAKRCKDNFLGVFPCDRLPQRLPPRRPLLLVCNTDPHDEPGEHWIVIYVGANSNGEYFDSLGATAPLIFKPFLDKHCAKWCSNVMQTQSVLSKFCGHYCVFYCLFKCLDYSLSDILNCFSSDTALNDLMVHKFVCNKL